MNIITKKNILVTGGCGYIGSHAIVELIEAGYRVSIIDNLSNSSILVLDRIRQITNSSETIVFKQIDLLNVLGLDSFFKQYGPFDACIHFAGLKAVGDSVKYPLHYYANNVQGSINLLYLLKKYNCRCVVFSSSATVYGDPEQVPIPETHRLHPTNPYGKTKQMIEEIFMDVEASQPREWSIMLLRYFNPIGSHPSGLIGEDPKGIPNNLVPYVSQVAVGKLKYLSVFGNDYDTPDGTGVRDYIHVVDIAKGHVAAINKAIESPGNGYNIYNLGTGNGTSVMEVIRYMREASNRPIDYVFAPRRAGDIATCFANPTKAKEELGWEANLSVEQAIKDSWNWQFKNPNGYV